MNNVKVDINLKIKLYIIYGLKIHIHKAIKISDEILKWIVLYRNSQQL